jgi:hypothetical protein
MKKAQQKIDSILTRWRDSGRAPTYTELTEVAAQLAQALTDAPKQPVLAPTQPISDFDAANAFMVAAHTDDVFAAYQQGVRLAERRHGITAPKEQHDSRL